MATIKTAISLQETLFKQVEMLAHDLDVSRSQLIALALEQFISKHHNQHLLEAINQSCDVDDEPDEFARNAARRLHHRQIVEGEW